MSRPLALGALVADDRRARLRAVRSLSAGGRPDALAYALRRVLFTDDDAGVRAAAASRLALLRAAGSEAWLLEAIGDRMPLVRDAIARGLAVCGGAAAEPALRQLVRDDHVWWVRRSAVYALAAVTGDATPAIDAFEAVLRDPFWRVRHAAVKVLAVLGARHPELRERVRGDSRDATRGGVNAAALPQQRGREGPLGIDLIISNPPLGSRVQLDAVALLIAALPGFARALAPRGRLVWITPSPRKTSPVAEQLGLVRTRAYPVDLGGVRGQLERWDRR